MFVIKLFYIEKQSYTNFRAKKDFWHRNKHWMKLKIKKIDSKTLNIQAIRIN